MANITTESQLYRVKVGHLQVIVTARDEAEAIALARREFAKELPRFYDLIRALESSRFELQKAA